MFVVAHVLIAVTWCNAGLAHDDDSGWTSIDTEPATGANVFINDEDHMIIGVCSGSNNVDGISHCASRKHMDAFPRANVDTSFAHDAFRLVNVEKLLWFDTLVEIVDGDFSERIATGKRWHWW